MNCFKIIAFTHKSVGLEKLGKYHLEDRQTEEKLPALKNTLGLDELMYLATCNRVEFFLSTEAKFDDEYLKRFFQAFQNKWNNKEIELAVNSALIFEGNDAVRHLFNVASSIDALVVGEREIITQVRNAYENCNKLKLTGDIIRLVVNKTIAAAKKIYTETDIARKSVSVVSLAYKKLLELNVALDARILLVGAGQTNTSMSKFLEKHGFRNFTVFNRTLENAIQLADDISGVAYSLDALKTYAQGFDVIITCTGSADFIITKEIYKKLLSGDTGRKVVIDLAVPNDFDDSILNDYNVNLIAVNTLKSIAEKNLREREMELVKCKKIIDGKLEEFKTTFKARQVELAMNEVPKKVKEINERALNEVFAKDIANLDEQSRETLDKILSYVEKKYISVPMKMAKEIILEK